MFRHNADSCLEWGTFLILEWFIQSVLVSGWTKKYSSKAFGLCLQQVLSLGQAHGLGYKMSKKKISQCPKKIVETVRKTRELLLKKIKKVWIRRGGKLQKGSEHKHKTTMSGQLLHLHGIKKFPAPGTEKYEKKKPHTVKKKINNHE